MSINPMREHPLDRINRYEAKLVTLHAELESAKETNCPAELYDASQAVMEYQDLIQEAYYELSFLPASEQ